MSNLQTTYDLITRNHSGLSFESFNIVKLVNDYRMFLKPERTKNKITSILKGAGCLVA